MRIAPTICTTLVTIIFLDGKSSRSRVDAATYNVGRPFRIKFVALPPLHLGILGFGGPKLADPLLIFAAFNLFKFLVEHREHFSMAKFTAAKMKMMKHMDKIASLQRIPQKFVKRLRSEEGVDLMEFIGENIVPQNDEYEEEEKEEEEDYPDPASNWLTSYGYE